MLVFITGVFFCVLQVWIFISTFWLFIKDACFAYVSPLYPPNLSCSVFFNDLFILGYWFLCLSYDFVWVFCHLLICWPSSLLHISPGTRFFILISLVLFSLYFCECIVLLIFMTDGNHFPMIRNDYLPISPVLFKFPSCLIRREYNQSFCIYLYMCVYMHMHLIPDLVSILY